MLSMAEICSAEVMSGNLKSVYDYECLDFILSEITNYNINAKLKSRLVLKSMIVIIIAKI